MPTKIHLVKAMLYPVVVYGCESWTIKKAECWRIDTFELWCWRRLLRVPWTARRSNQFILKEISPGCSLEGLMLKTKLKYFGHLMQRADSLRGLVTWANCRLPFRGETFSVSLLPGTVGTLEPFCLQGVLKEKKSPGWVEEGTISSFTQRSLLIEVTHCVADNTWQKYLMTGSILLVWIKLYFHFLND